jgi:hypothetical protein
MKRIPFAILFLFFALNQCFAQDLIIKKSGQEVKAKVQEIGQADIKYKNFDTPEGPNLIMMKSEILMIRYENGTKDIFNSNDGKKMGLSKFILLAGSNTAAVSGVVGAVYDANKNAKDAPYYAKLEIELKSIIENLLNSNDFFQYIPSAKLTFPQSEKAVQQDELAKNNDIYACITAKSSLGVAVGWQKKVCLTTVWEIVNVAGYKLKIKTYSVSEEKQGMFPDVGDPKLEPVWVELIKENTKQFLDKFSEQMKKDKNLQ